MRTNLGDRIHLDLGEISREVPMEGANTVLVDYTIFVITGGSLTVELEESNDLENWSAVASDTQSTVGDYFLRVPSAGSGIASRFVRLTYAQNSTGNVILGAGLETTDQ